MSFTHFLVTRFNLRIDTWETTKNGQCTLTDEWLQERFQLFEKFCLPSVRQQSVQDFTWCLFFDSNTSKGYRERIQAIASQYRNIRLFFIEGIKQLPITLKAFIEEITGTGNKYIITTRLDNDDLLHRNFIKEIQARFIPIHRAVIDLRCGYQLCIKHKYAEFRYLKNEFNPFVSVIEEADKVETVMSRMHRDWVKADHVVIVSDRPLWIELVHHSNKLNDVNYGNPKLFDVDLAAFSLNKDFIKMESRLQLLLERFVVGLRTKRLVTRYNRTQ